MEPDDLGRLVATRIREARLAVGWSERELARRLATNQAAVQRLEDPDRTTLNVHLATAALRLLGMRVTVDGVRVGRARQRDAVHAWCCAHVVRNLRRRGWEVRVEVEIGEGRSLGWIDILAYRRSDRSLLVIEVKTQIDDAGRVLRTLGWYTRSSRSAAERLGWRPARIVPVLIALATAETDARIAAQWPLFGAALGGGSVHLARWIDDPAAASPGPSRALIDPAGRGRMWLQRDRIDRRRTPLPYADYRDAARRFP